MWWSKDDSANDQQDGAIVGFESQAVAEIKEQFEQQQVLVHQLKELVRQNEEQLKCKEYELQDSASKLSKLKMQHKARMSQMQNQLQESQKNNPVTKGDEETSSATPGTPTADPSRGKVLMLQKKLEENRMRFQRREKEMDDNKRSVEQVIKIMQTQLEERDSIIEVLKKRNENDSGAHVQEFPASASGPPSKDDSTIQKMYAQIVYKDSRMLELDGRIMELERNVIDLQETISEKDEVIRARNTAIQLMTDDLSRRGKVVVDHLEDTRDEMRMMQQNFSIMEAAWREEKELLIRDLATAADKDQRLSEAKDSLAKLETTRFELSTRNAELQEKVVWLQEMLEKLKSQMKPANEQELKGLKDENERLNALVLGNETTIAALKSSVDLAIKDGEQRFIKLKAQHKTALKKMEKQIQQLKGGARNDDLEILQQTTDELEKIKERQKIEIDDWRAKYERQSQDLENDMRMISILEKNKLDVLEQLTLSDEKVATLQLSLEQLRQELGVTLGNQKQMSADADELRLSHTAKLSELEDASSRIAVLTAETERDHQTIADLQLTVEQLKFEIVQMKSALDAGAAELIGERENGGRLVTEIEQLSQKLAKITEEMENGNAKEDFETDERLTVLLERLTATQKLQDSERQDWGEERCKFNEYLRERDNQLTELMEELQLKTQEMECLRDALNEARLKSRSIQDELQEVQTFSQSQEARIQEYVDSISAGDADLTAAVERISNLGTELRVAQAQVEEFMSSTRDAKHQIQVLSEKVSTQEKELKTSCEQLDEKGNQLDTILKMFVVKEEELKIAMDQLAAKENQIQIMKDELTAMTSELVRTSDELDSKKVELDILLRKMAIKEEELVMSSDQLSTIKIKMTEMAAEADATVDRLTALETELEQQRVAFESKRDVCDVQTYQIANLHSEVHRLSNENLESQSQMTADADATLARLLALETDLEQQRIAFENKRDECDVKSEQIANLHSEVLCLSNNNIAAQKQVTQLLSVSNTYEHSKLELAAQLEAKHSQLSSSKVEVLRLTTILSNMAKREDQERLAQSVQLVELEQQVTQLVLERDAAIKQSDNLALELSSKLEACLRSVNSELEDSRAGYERLKAEFIDVEDRLHVAQESNKSFEAEIESLACLKKVLEAKLKILEEDGRVQEDEKHALVSRNKQAEERIFSLESVKDSLETKILAIEANNGSLMATTNSLESKLSLSEEGKVLLEVQKQEVENERELLKEKNRLAETENELQRVTLEALENKYSSLEMEKGSVEVEKQELESVKELLEEKIRFAESENMSLKSTLETFEMKYGLLEREKGSLLVEKQEISSQIEAECILIKAENEFIKVEMSSLTTKCNLLSEEKGSLEIEMQELISKNKLLEDWKEAKNEEFETEKKLLKDRIELLLERCNSLEEENKSFGDTEQSLKAKIDALQDDCQLLKGEHDIMMAQFGLLQKEKEDMLIEQDSLKSNWSLLKEQASLIDVEKEALVTKIQVLEDEKNTMQVESESHKAHMIELQEQICQLESLRMTLSSLDAEVGDAHGQLQEVRLANHSLETENRSLKRDLESFETFKLESERRITEQLVGITEQLEVISKEKVYMEEKMAQEIAEKHLECEQSKSNVDLLTTQLDSVGLQVATAESEKLALIQKIGHLEGEMLTTTDHLNQLTSANASLQKELEEVNRCLLGVSSEKNGLELDIGQLRDNIAHLQLCEAKLQNSTQVVIDLEGRIASLTDELRNSNEQNQRMMQYTQQLESDLESTSESLQMIEQARDDLEAKIAETEASLSVAIAARDEVMVRELEAINTRDDMKAKIADTEASLSDAIGARDAAMVRELEAIKMRDDLDAKLSEIESSLSNYIAARDMAVAQEREATEYLQKQEIQLQKYSEESNELRKMCTSLNQSLVDQLTLTDALEAEQSKLIEATANQREKLSQLEAHILQLEHKNNELSQLGGQAAVTNGSESPEKGSLEIFESKMLSAKHDGEFGKLELLEDGIFNDVENGLLFQDANWKQIIIDRDYQVAALHDEIVRLGGDYHKLYESGAPTNSKFEILKQELCEAAAALSTINAEKLTLLNRLETEHQELKAALSQVDQLTNERANLASRLLKFEGIQDKCQVFDQQNSTWIMLTKQLSDLVELVSIGTQEDANIGPGNDELKQMDKLVERVQSLIAEKGFYRSQLDLVKEEKIQLEEEVKNMRDQLSLASAVQQSSTTVVVNRPDCVTEDRLVTAAATATDSPAQVEASGSPSSPEHQQLRSQLAISKMKSEKMLVKLKQFKDKNDKLQLQIGDLMQHSANVEDDNSKLRDANQHAHGEVCRLSNELRHSERFWKSEVKMLNDRLDTVEVANGKLVEIKDELETRLDAQLEKCNRLVDNDAALESLRLEMDSAKSQLESTKSELDFVKSELDSVHSELYLVKSELDSVKSELVVAQSELKVARSQNDALASELVAVRLENETSKSHSELAKIELNSMKLELQVQVNRCREINESNAALELRVAFAESGNREAADQLGLTVQRLQGQLASATEHNKFLESDNHEYQELIARLEDEQRRREAQVREQSERVVLLQSELGRFREAVAMAPVEISDHAVSKRDSETVMAELRQDCQDARKRCKDLENECHILNREVSELRVELDAALEERDRLEGERDAMIARLTSKEFIEASRSYVCGVADGAGGIMEDERSRVQSVLVAAVDDGEQDAGDWNDSDASMTVQNADCSHCPSLRREITQLTERNADLTKRLSAAESNVWTLEDEKQQVMDDARGREASALRQSRTDSAALIAANAELTSRSTQLSTDLESLRLRHEQLELEYRLTFQRQRETVAGLEALLEERCETDEARGVEVEQLRQQLSDTMEVLAKRTAMLETHAERAARLGSQLSVAEGEVKSAEVERSALADEVKRLRSETWGLEQQLTNWKQHLGGFRRRGSDVDEDEARWPSVHETSSDPVNDDVVARLEAELSETMKGLHRRDLRCEELTSEISRMVEERDSLQIRLSRVMRADQHKDIEIHLLRQEQLRREQDTTADNRLQQNGDDSNPGVPETEQSDMSKRLSKCEEQRMELQRLNAVLDDALATEREHSSRLMADLKLANEELIVRTKGPKRMESANISINEETPLVPEYSQTLVRSYTGTPWRIANWLQGRSLKRVLHV